MYHLHNLGFNVCGVSNSFAMLFQVKYIPHSDAGHPAPTSSDPLCNNFPRPGDCPGPGPLRRLLLLAAAGRRGRRAVRERVRLRGGERERVRLRGSVRERVRLWELRRRAEIETYFQEVRHTRMPGICICTYMTYNCIKRN